MPVRTAGSAAGPDVPSTSSRVEESLARTYSAKGSRVRTDTSGKPRFGPASQAASSRSVAFLAIQRCRPSGRTTRIRPIRRLTPSALTATHWSNSGCDASITRTREESRSDIVAFCRARRRQDDDRAPRSADPSLRNHRDRQRELALQKPHLSRRTTPACPGGQTGTSRAALRRTRGGHSAPRGALLFATGTSLNHRPKGSGLDADRGSNFHAD